MTALCADQIDLLMWVVDALARCYVHERDGAALIVGEVNEAAVFAQALLPWQHPAFTQYAVNVQVAGVKA
ncbi:hypothetical protein ALP73_200031 [Pseudomonas coronafaciens pv. garcae]|uniref:Uncharacterized protein n=1 Tax=Pseudomonas coronafaciens pv. garcae TaxID=251653 RepID=A0AB37QKP5_9PSED|nr:hypothetical protein ALP74_200583 [Pseudomonas coronafaciens pv. garcae]RMS02246.1 hypothetical protein ALP73_200031 [Pseudomonas coronafaciens pv. garcae]RMS97886.1 hypothetical protein ALP56_200108 [Pseudomonas coronafaciens pv. oryzae]